MRHGLFSSFPRVGLPGGHERCRAARSERDCLASPERTRMRDRMSRDTSPLASPGFGPAGSAPTSTLRGAPPDRWGRGELTAGSMAGCRRGSDRASGGRLSALVLASDATPASRARRRYATACLSPRWPP